MDKSRDSGDDAARRLSEASAVLEDAAAKLQTLVDQVKEALISAGVKPRVGERKDYKNA